MRLCKNCRLDCVEDLLVPILTPTKAFNNSPSLILVLLLTLGRSKFCCPKWLRARTNHAMGDCFWRTIGTPKTP
eukprot:6179546-Amphidinium_carterae.1